MFIRPKEKQKDRESEGLSGKFDMYFPDDLEDFAENDKFRFISENMIKGYKIIFINREAERKIEAKILTFNENSKAAGFTSIVTKGNGQISEDFKNIGINEGIESLIKKLKSWPDKDSDAGRKYRSQGEQNVRQDSSFLPEFCFRLI